MHIAVALFVVVSATSMTPEEEVEAWQPGVHEASPDDDAKLGTRIATVLVPVGSLFVGGIVGYGTFSVVSSLVGFPIAPWAGLAAGLVVFDALLAGGLNIFLPDALPSWTVPVAVGASTVAALGAIAIGAGFIGAYASAVYAGSDCVCGADILIILPLTVAALTMGSVVAATNLTVLAAESDGE